MKDVRQTRAVHRRLWVAVLVAFSMAALASGCGSDDDGGSSAGESGGTSEKAVIGNAVPQGSDPALTIQTEALVAEAKTHGMSVISADANLDLNKQVADVDSFIQRKVDALVIWPMDSDGIQPALQRAQDADVPVITRQTTVGRFFTNIQTDDRQAGRQAAEFLAKELGRGAKVAAIIGPQQVESFRDLAEGFKEGAAAGGLDVVDTQTNQDLTPEASATFTEQFAQRHGEELQGIFDSLDATALATAAARKGSFNPIVVTYGGSDEALDAIREGRLSAMLYQEPVMTGRAEGWAADKAVKGEQLPAQIYVDEPVVDKANIDEFPPSSEQLAANKPLELVKQGDRNWLVYEGDQPPAGGAGQ